MERDRSNNTSRITNMEKACNIPENSNCSKKIKVIVHNAILSSKIMHSVESMQLTDAMLGNRQFSVKGPQANSQNENNMCGKGKH